MKHTYHDTSASAIHNERMDLVAECSDRCSTIHSFVVG
jgi:hypothetical protein